MTRPSARRIRVLAPQLANQIAAGEVVERPASVLKELLENSIDAGANRIEVDLERAGIGLIRVRDDGYGIHPDDLPLALARHATSKIHEPHELTCISSLGFRGEALASIASVSRFSLTSRAGGSEHGWRVVLENESPPLPAAHPVGTTVEVRDLFHQTPARRKFLKTERTELSHLEEVLRRVALSRFEVGFTLRHNGRRLLELRPAGEAADHEGRLAALCGRPFLSHALAVAFEAGEMRLTGWVGGPGFSRAQADLQYFFLNGRIVRDKLIAHALRVACGEAIEAGRHAAFVLYLELPPEAVDVNVHPTKHEVRFREPRLVHDFLVRAVRDALSGHPAASGGAGGSRYSGGHTGGVPAGPAAVAESVAAYGRLHPPVSNTPLHGRFLAVEHEGGVALIDQPRARARIAHARLAASLAGEGIRRRPLLIPEPVEVGAECAARLEGAAGAVERLGFVIGRLAEAVVVVREVPALLARPQLAPLMALLCNAIAGSGGDDPLLRGVAEQSVGPEMEGPKLLEELRALDGDESGDGWVLVRHDELERRLG